MNRNYLLRRGAQAVFTLWAVVTITFVLVKQLPGNAQALIAVRRVGAGAAGGSELDTGGEVAKEPLLDAYVNFVTSIVQGNFGESIFFNEPVSDILVEAVPWTVFVVAVALALTFLIGIALGAILAYREGTRFDFALSSLSTVLNSIPYYVTAVLFVYIFGYQLAIFPATGRQPSGVTPGFTPEFIGGVLHHAALPIGSIVVAAFGFQALAMRGNAIQVLGKDYVRVANLRGLPDNRIALLYVGRNAVLPMYTSLMIAIGAAMGSTVIIEEIFQFRGLGFYFFRAIAARDYPLMMGAFIIISATIVLGLFVADLTYGLIDPRASVTGSDGGSSGGRSLRVRLRALAASLRRFKNDVRARLTGGTTEDSGGRSTRRQRPDADVDTSVFHTTSAEMPTRSERYRRSFQEYVVAPWRIIWNDWRARIGTAIVALFVLTGIVGPRLVAAPKPNQGPRLLGAFQSMAHPLGTDSIGHDLVSQLVYATTPMLEMMLTGAVFATTVATIIGIIAGYNRGRLDEFLMLVSDIVLSIPGLPLVMILAVLFQPTEPWAIGILLTVNAWGGTARQIRSQVLAIGQESYIEASSIMSLPLSSIMLKDILPNIGPFVFVRFVQLARRVIISSVALYFLGVLPFTTQNWGVMLNLAYKNGALYTFDTAHWVLTPIIAIVGLIFGLILFAQGTDRIFNPQVRSRHVEESDESASGGGSGGTAVSPGDD